VFLFKFKKPRRKIYTPISRRGLRLSTKKKGLVDKGLLFTSLMLTILGFVAIADASAPLALSVFSDSLYFVKQQILWGILGFILLIVSSMLPYNFWKKIALPLFVLSVILLILVLFPAFGSKVLGARRWLNLGLVSFQPSEFVKLTLAIYLAYLLEKKKAFWINLIPIILVSGLIMLQPDLGTTIIIILIGFSQLFVSGINILWLAGLGLLTTLSGFLLIHFSEYRRERVLSFIKSISDPLGSSYHIRQILLALGSGGITGVGLGQSRQKFLFLPEVATDSVFAIISEEIGFIGASVIIIGFFFLTYKMYKIALKTTDPFSRYLATAITAWIGGQVFLNIGSMVALVPLTGIPLPFFSYGGSSLVMILVAIGILINISKHAKE